MTLTEILALLTFLVTTVYDTIDIVLRFREFRTKNGQKNDRPTFSTRWRSFF